MSFSASLAAQLRQPCGRFGRIVGWLMTRGNRIENERTLDLLAVQPDDHVLEVGFGPGLTLAGLLRRIPRGRVTGLDYSAEMVDQAGRRNAAAIAAGRLALQHGDVAALPFADRSFNRAFCVNVIYFWADPLHCLGELRRVLRPGGRVAVCFGARHAMEKHRLTRNGFRLYEAEEIVDLLIRAGFSSTTVTPIETRKGLFFCVTGDIV